MRVCVVLQGLRAEVQELSSRLAALADVKSRLGEAEAASAALRGELSAANTALAAMREKLSESEALASELRRQARIFMAQLSTSSNTTPIPGADGACALPPGARMCVCLWLCVCVCVCVGVRVCVRCACLYLCVSRRNLCVAQAWRGRVRATRT